MRLLSCLSVVLAVLCWTGCKPSGPPVEAQWRFVGGNTLQQQTNAPVLRDILTVKEAAPLYGLLVTNVAEQLWFLTTGETNIPASAVPHGAVIVDTVLSKLSLGQAYRGSGGRRDWAVAIPADAATDALKVAWAKFFAAANPAAVPEVAVSGPWLVAVSDSKRVTPAAVLGQLAKIPAEAGDGLRLELNPERGPGVALVAQLKDGVVRMNAKLKFTGGEAFPASLPAWQVPRLVRDPLVQFAAVRWPAPLLERLPGLKMITGDSRPSQFFIWGNPSSPTVPEVRVYGAFVGLDPQKRFQEIVNALEPVFNVAESNSVYEGSIKVEPTLPRISLNGFPLLTPPTVLVITNDVAPYLLVGAARPVLSSNRPPAELLQQVERPGVVYYQWEITGETLRNLTALDQGRDMLTRQRAFIRSGVLRWVQAVAALTELNSVTEASITGDREVTVTRKAPVGLTALELVAVARWLGEDAPLDRSRRTGPPAPAPRNR
jgi:hypothetical protein